jgi:molecular chaperone GrpE (heat shock protein)
MLNEILKSAKGEGITIVQLEISKAFDTVPHEVIGDALRRKVIPETIVKLIRDSYNGMSTLIKRGEVEVPINLQRAAKH